MHWADPFKSRIFAKWAGLSLLFISLVVGTLVLVLAKWERAELIQIEYDLATIIEERLGADLPQVLSDQYLNQLFQTEMTKAAFLGSAVGLVLMFGFSLLFYGLVARPIRALQELAASEDQGQKLYFPEDKLPRDEIGHIARRRNHHVETIHAFEANRDQQVEKARRRLYEETRRDLVDDLSAAFAAEFNQPLAILENYSKRLSQEMEKSIPSPMVLKKCAERVQYAFHKLKLTTSHMEQFHQSQLQFAPHKDLRLILDRVIMLFEADFKERGVRLEFQYPKDAIEFWGHARAIEQLLLNVLDNALEAVKGIDPAEQPSITLTVASNRDFVVIKIADNGIGIPHELKEDAFTAYCTSRGHKGQPGMGLSVCRAIVQAHQGTIELESTQEKTKGRGTVVTVALPRLIQKSHEESPPQQLAA